MAYLHGKSIIHFDLKSGNVLLSTRDKRPVCKVADLGLCKRRRDTYASGVTAQRGTLPYTAPEVLRTPGQVTEKADVYSFGVLLWELWTGKEPYEGQNYHALLHQLSQPNTRLRPPLPQTPEWEDRGGGPRELAPGWAALVESCWAEDPDQRPGFPEIVKTLRDQALSLKHSARSRAKALPAAAAPPRS
ncbi:protein kinase [Helicosporidium sp. ATCC 50920]|nr:protein kinase [Helicosporidium sp. ATCC 50920]|eukprot:KDD71458.1 protein kinase [Helicosporidium sp. ATCC 50920]